MKKLICLTLIAIMAGNILAQPQQEKKHEWKATVKVLDEEGNPVVGAKAGVGYFGSGGSIDGLTDTNGMFVATHSTTPGLLGCLLSFRVEKDGYYSTWKQIDLGPGYDPAKWNPTVALTLKKIGQPIAMYARGAQIEVPVVDKQIGFDLIESDWIAPYGKGKQSDIVFETHRRWVSRRDFDSTLKITFPNSGDGLLAAPASPVQGSSGPHIPVTAPLDGYKPQLSRELSNTLAEGWKDDSKNQNYYVRVRTVPDENGNIKSALYGKIYGDFGLDPINSKTTWVLVTYYLNPTPNSRNVEFDPNQNLLKNLPALQQVKDP